MVCKKCGYSTLIQNGDWLKCPNCGAEYFNTKIDFGISAKDEIDDFLSEDIDSIKNNSDFNIDEKEIADISKSDLESSENADTFEEVETKFQFTNQVESSTSKENASNSNNEQYTFVDSEEFEENKKKNKKEKKKKAKKEKPKKEKKEKKNKTKKDKADKSVKEIDDNNSNEENNNEKSKSKFKDILDFITPIVVAVIIALLLKTFVFANAVVPTPSMVNTIKEKDRIIASRLSYIKDDPERYDIVMFNYPDDEKVIYVKRIIGLPGETVTVVNGVVFVQDKDGNLYQTDQTFITNEVPKGDFGPYYIPFKGEKITSDGEFCYAENGMIVGKVQFIEKYCEKDKDGNFVKDENGKYIVAENNYFCMGDNRNHSLDSRYWENTYVSKSKFLGKVLFRYFPSFEQLK